MADNVLYGMGLTRLSGSGTDTISISVKQGKLEKAVWEPAERPRAYQTMLAGMSWENVPYVCARICGSCFIGHTLACIAAIEDAFAIMPSLQTLSLRKLLKHMELLSGHVKNLFFNPYKGHSCPDSLAPTAHNEQEIVRRAARLKTLASDATEMLGGGINACRIQVGGFSEVPALIELEVLRKRLKGSLKDLTATGGFLDSSDTPDFVTDSEFLSLSLMEEGEYPLMGSSMGGEHDIHAIHAGKCRTAGGDGGADEFRSQSDYCAMGALARVNNNFIYLHPAARRMSESLGLSRVNRNPFMSDIARLVECVHAVMDSIEIIEELLNFGYGESRSDVNPRDGLGTGAVEVPTGIIRHTYEFNSRGEVVKSDCFMPMDHGYAHIRQDLEKLTEQFAALGKRDEEIEDLAHLLVRAWDPCVSCVH